MSFIQWELGVESADQNEVTYENVSHSFNDINCLCPELICVILTGYETPGNQNYISFYTLFRTIVNIYGEDVPVVRFNNYTAAEFLPSGTEHRVYDMPSYSACDDTHRSYFLRVDCDELLMPLSSGQSESTARPDAFCVPVRAIESINIRIFKSYFQSKRVYPEDGPWYLVCQKHEIETHLTHDDIVAAFAENQLVNNKLLIDPDWDEYNKGSLRPPNHGESYPEFLEKKQMWDRGSDCHFSR